MYDRLPLPSQYSVSRKKSLHTRKSIRTIFAPFYKYESREEPTNVHEKLQALLSPRPNKLSSSYAHKNPQGNDAGKVNSAKSIKRPSVHTFHKGFGHNSKRNAPFKQASINKIKEKYSQLLTKAKSRSKTQTLYQPPPIFRFPLSQTKVSASELARADATKAKNKTEQQQQETPAPDRNTNPSYKLSDYSNYNPYTDPQIYSLVSSLKQKYQNQNAASPTHRDAASRPIHAEKGDSNGNAAKSSPTPPNPLKGNSIANRRQSVNAIRVWNGKAKVPSVKSTQLKSLMAKDKYSPPSVKTRTREQEFRSLYRRIKVTYFLHDEAYNSLAAPQKLFRAIQSLNKFEEELVHHLAYPSPHPQARGVLQDLRQRRNDLLAKSNAYNKENSQGLAGNPDMLFFHKNSTNLSKLALRGDGKKQVDFEFIRTSSNFKKKSNFNSSEPNTLFRNSNENQDTTPDSSQVASNHNLRDMFVGGKEVFKRLKVLEAFLKIQPKSTETEKMLKDVSTSIVKFQLSMPEPVLDGKQPEPQSTQNPKVSDNMTAGPPDSAPTKTSWKKSDFVRLLPHRGEILKNVSKVASKVPSASKPSPLGNVKEDGKPYMSWLEEIMANKVANNITVLHSDPKDSYFDLKTADKIEEYSKPITVLGPINRPLTVQQPTWAQSRIKTEAKLESAVIFKRLPPRMAIDRGKPPKPPENGGKNYPEQNQSRISDTAIIPFKPKYEMSNGILEKVDNYITNYTANDLYNKNNKAKELSRPQFTPQNASNSTTDGPQSQSNQIPSQRYGKQNYSTKTSVLFEPVSLSQSYSHGANVSNLMQPKSILYDYNQDSHFAINDPSPDVSRPQTSPSNKDAVNKYSSQIRKDGSGHVDKGKYDFKNPTSRIIDSEMSNFRAGEKHSVDTGKQLKIETNTNYVPPSFSRGNLSILNFPHSLGLKIRQNEYENQNGTIRMKLPLPNYVKPLTATPTTAASVLNRPKF